jgi:hypothetical protein
MFLIAPGRSIDGLKKPIFFVSTLEKVENGTFNIAFKIKSGVPSDFVYALEMLSEEVGNIHCYNPSTSQHEGVLYNLPDSIRIVIQEKSPDVGIGWRKHIVTDTITYVRCKVESYIICE